MAFTKVSVTLEPDVADELRRVAGRRGLSAFVNEAVRQQLQAVRVRRMLAGMAREHGEIPASARARVDAVEWPE